MHALDVRWPLGSMFALIGAMLVIYGMCAVEPRAALDSAWGAILLLFGAFMLWLASRGAKAARKS